MKHNNMLARATTKAPPAFDFSGEWGNELGSTMEIVQEGSVVTGVYTSAVSSTGTSVTGSLSGYAQGELIAFSVNWPTQAITAWVGRHRRDEDGDSQIETLWQMTTFGDDGDGGFWHSLYAGADRFTRTEPEAANEPAAVTAGGGAEAPAGTRA